MSCVSCTNTQEQPAVISAFGRGGEGKKQSGYNKVAFNANIFVRIGDKQKYRL